MARKFRITTPRIKIVNRCIICSKFISNGNIICKSCRHGRRIIKKSKGKII